MVLVGATTAPTAAPAASSFNNADVSGSRKQHAPPWRLTNHQPKLELAPNVITESISNFFFKRCHEDWRFFPTQCKVGCLPIGCLIFVEPFAAL